MLNSTRRYIERLGLFNRARVVRSLKADESGSVLPIMAGAILLLVVLIGSGVDMSRAYKAERRLQAACDAGALAGRRAVTTGGFDRTVQDQARAYFYANFNATEEETHPATFVPSSEDDGASIVGTATATLDTVLMKIVGFNNFNLSVTCSASMGVGNSDIMFVLDNTGSMSSKPDGTTPGRGEQSKLQALQAAMKDFYDTVETSTTGSNARVRYGFVPYSSSVNVGRLLNDRDGTMISNSLTVQSLELVNWSTNPVRSWTDSNYTYSSPSYGSWVQHTTTKYSNNTCKPSGSSTSAVPADTAWVDNGTMTYDTSSLDVDNTTGHQIKTTGNHQPQTMTDYECRKSGNDYYVYRRTGTRDKRGTQYEERTQIPVTTNNTAFTTGVLQQRTFDVSSFKTFTSVSVPIGVNTGVSPNRTSNVSSTWGGCIQERQTVAASSFSFVSLETGITPATALDLDIDAAPNGSDASKWKVLWPQVTFDRDLDAPYDNLDNDRNGSISTTEYNDNKASSACPYQSRALATMTKAQFEGYVGSLVATGNTYHDIGILWGARLSSPTGIWGGLVNAEPDNGSTVSRHMIFMTDGILQPSLTVNSSYGIEFLDKRITGNGNGTTQYNNHRSRFLALCEAVKARGIRLWVIAFGTSLTSDLTTCATDGLASAFQADNADQLNEHFQEIAKQVGELRIVQ